MAESGYVRRPYVRQPYTPDTRSIGALLMRQGQDQGTAAAIRGATAAQLWENLARGFQQYQNTTRDQAERAATIVLRQQEQQAQAQLKRDEMEQRRQEREEAARLRQETADRQRQMDAEKRGTAVAEQVGYGPMSEPQMTDVLQSPAAGRARYSFGPGTAEGPELLPTKDQQKAIEAEQTITAMGGTLGPNGQVVMPPKPASMRLQPAMVNGRRVFVRVDDQGNAFDPAGKPVQAEPIPPQQSSAQEPLVSIMGEDGNPVYVPRSQAVGQRPASNREQGRAVTSGDAGDLADYTTALDDIAFVRSALAGNKATGAKAAVGAAIPNWATEFTGWGADAKQKQAVIDRVKQVIGKTLEGGVLRKEDEIKYGKILPTISDPPELVTSKLAGLQEAITKRQQRKVDALADAGYDVEKFRARGSVSAVPDLNGVKDGFSRTFKSGPFAGQTWTMVNGQPVKVQ